MTSQKLINENLLNGHHAYAGALLSIGMMDRVGAVDGTPLIETGGLECDGPHVGESLFVLAFEMQPSR